MGVNSEEVTIYQGGNFTSYTHKEEDVVHTDQRGNKRYELTNHLGNVLAVINDRKIYNSTDQNYDPVLLSWSDYYAFGMTMPGRNGNTGEYRYGYQGSEMDNEVKGNGNSYTTFFRQLDPRLGRWKSPDPVFQPHQSPYNSMDNNPVWFNDPLGDKIKFKGTAKQKRQLRRAFRAARKADAGFDAWYTRRKKEKTVNIMRIQGANPKVKTETFKNPRKVSQAEGGGSAIQDITIDDHGNEIGADGSPVEKHIGRGANESTYYFARLKKTTTKERISSYKAFFNGFATGYDNHRGIYEKDLKLHSNDFVLLPGYARAAEGEVVGNFSLSLRFTNVDDSEILSINHTYFSPPRNTPGYNPFFGRYTGISKTLLMKVSVKVTDREGVNSNGIFRNYNTIANFRIRVLSFKRKTSSSWGFFDVFRMNKIRLINLE
ncbi:hypothetical protein GCM10009118_34420 [Wandonia haliotis]|uniref:RHS repeat-associated core domain-containing protein n=1 Tax=Wandonia haliotis TaxID=574963 RepID=A0ABP3Y8A3_9FLAO